MLRPILCCLCIAFATIAEAAAPAIPPASITTGALTNALGYTPLGGQYTPGRSLRATIQGIAPTYQSGAYAFTPASTPTDIAALELNGWGQSASLRHIRISCTATAVSTFQVLLQRSANGGAGTSAQQYADRSDLYDASAYAGFYTYTVNRTSNGNGISSSRPLIRMDNITCGTATAAGVDINWEFGRNGEKSPTIKNINDWLVVNLAGQTMPSGISMNMEVEWQEERVVRIGMVGDSTTALATPYFIHWPGTGSTGGGIGYGGALNGITSIDNNGSNGFRFLDFLENLNSVTWPLSTVMSHNYDVYVICYGINDIRTGLTTQAQLMDEIDAAIYAIHNGTVNGGTYTASEAGNAGTVFTWSGNQAAAPNALIILWGPNGFTADDSGSGAPNYYLTQSATVSNASWLGGVATYTTSAAHGYPIGTPIQAYITGISPSGFNSATSTTAVTITATDTTHFTAAIVSSPGSFVSGGTVYGLSGLWAGQTLAQAALSASQILYNAYAAFASDPRIYALVQKQDLYLASPLDGKTQVPAFPGWRGVNLLANTPVVTTNSGAQSMSNQIHPNSQFGQTLVANQIYPYLVSAVNAVMAGFVY